MLITALAVPDFGLSINTMTLGGIAIAIGELVDDAVVDVENVYRRLRENALAAVPQPVLGVVAYATGEVRSGIVMRPPSSCFVFFRSSSRPGLKAVCSSHSASPTSCPSWRASSRPSR
jgi:HME family heavy-metal exporter